MPVLLGLDIGSNSVGSAWVDTEARQIVLGDGVFPAGVEERENKRGDPKNKARRSARLQRRSIARRARRKQYLRMVLARSGLLPNDPAMLREIFSPANKEDAEKWDPWLLRRKGLEKELSPYEFGRVLVHLNQRRGALGVEVDPEDPEEGKVKEAIQRLQGRLAGRTVGQFMADLIDQRQRPISGGQGTCYREAIRNRRDAFEFHATRAQIREEFNRLWDKQKSFGGELSRLLTDELKRTLDEPEGDRIWRQGGALFGQRRTYWRTATLGRCDLEPTDRHCPVADRHAQEFRILETINNLRIEERGKPPRPLGNEEREKVLQVLRSQKTATVVTIRKALGLQRKEIKAFFTLNLERDPEREINTDWFYRAVVHGVFTERAWQQMTEGQRESVNRALLKFDTDLDEHAARLRNGAMRWWNLSAEAAEKLVEAWKGRPKLDKRVNLSRRAIQNLLPYLRQGLTVSEARQRFAEDPLSPATPEQRVRYALKGRPLNKAGRQFRRKHPDLLPPAPMLANPVVRKAIHEVRRHLNAYLRRFSRKPDRVVIELARSATQPAHVRNEALARNRRREAIHKEIIAEFKLEVLPPNQQAKAVQRVLLCRQQRNVCAYSDGPATNDKAGMCPYSGRTITDRMAAVGVGVDGIALEIDHIVPLSRSQDNGLNNKVLCYVEANRGKGSQTPKEWLGADSERFQLLEQRLAHLERGENVYPYFTKKDCTRKWENLHRDAPDLEGFTRSQLTDTAYAARQVAQWLRDALYDGERDGTRHVFTTKGIYTAILRRDWGLAEESIDRQWHPGSVRPVAGQDEEPSIGRKDKKDRTDHRHHAIDALVIALSGPERIEELARLAAEQEAAKAQSGRRPKGKLKPPWGTPDEFRAQVMAAIAGLVVCHRPVKRRLVGALHLDTPYGKAEEYPGLYSFRMSAKDLQPSNLRPPKKKIARDGTVTWGIEGRGQGSVVRSPALREAIRRCLQNLKPPKDPDTFTEKDIKELTDRANYKLRFPSGVPIYDVTMVRTLSDPIRIKGRDGVERFYVGGNNHHFEIAEDPKTRQWSGACIDMYTAARRVRPPKGQPAQPLVQRGPGFVMSLAEGETVHMRHPETGRPDYFVVFKLSKEKVFLIHHWDARPDKAKPGVAKREPIERTPAQLQQSGPEPGTPPYKVRVGPLGDLTPLRND